MPLNFTGNQLLSLYSVAPFTGAWIETLRSRKNFILLNRFSKSDQKGIKPLVAFSTAKSILNEPVGHLKELHCRFFAEETHRCLKAV